MYGHLLGADLAFFHANPSGTLISRLTNDVAVMRQAMGECLTNSFKGGLTLAFLIGIMFYQDWRLSVATFVVFPVSAMFVARVGRRMRKLSASTQAEIGNFSALLGQSFLGMRHVKAYGMEKAELDRVQSVTERIYSLAVRGYRQSALTSPVTELMNGLAFGAAMLYGGWRIDVGALTPGGLASFIAAFGFAYTPIKRMAKVNAQLQAGLAASERVFDLLDLKPEIVDALNAKVLDTPDYSVTLNDVVFNYADGTLALDHLSIVIPHGKTVAIVGPSGAGKSTIINLIPRFYDVQGGSIAVGGQDIRETDRWRACASISASSVRKPLCSMTRYGPISLMADRRLRMTRYRKPPSMLLPTALSAICRRVRYAGWRTWRETFRRTASTHRYRPRYVAQCAGVVAG